MSIVTRIFILLSTSTTILGCKPDEIKLIEDIAGSWRVKQITYSRTTNSQISADSVVTYLSSSMNFGKCKGGCNGSYRLNGYEEVSFYYYVQPNNNGLSINVGPKTGQGVNPLINLNGQAYIVERSTNRMLIDFDVIINRADGIPIPGSYRAKAVLER